VTRLLKVVLATGNPGKIAEMKQILGGLPLEFLALKDFPELGHADEDGLTFEENAAKKAIYVWEHTRLLSIADDSGLEVDALDGQPGIFSARFAGEHASYEANNRKLLALLRGVPTERRKARFVFVAALIRPEGEMLLRRGSLEGVIAEAPTGSCGFGYDPIFYVPAYGKTVAELDEAVKNTISHRARALSGIKQVIEELLPK
jgi:XTP/dITP diphosphohydrolase